MCSPRNRKTTEGTLAVVLPVQNLSGARHTSIGHNSVLQHVEGDLHQNYINRATCQEEEENRVMVRIESLN
ncbi:hypothetical protein PM082_019694 [Marasmius tenuissimus]|nr:hypothetical protein PM082_019694 [Marasmius tenuissimus]